MNAQPENNRGCPWHPLKMEETYCIKDKKYIPCVEPSGYQSDKNGRKQFCHCAVCGIKKVRYVKSNGFGEKKA